MAPRKPSTIPSSKAKPKSPSRKSTATSAATSTGKTSASKKQSRRGSASSLSEATSTGHRHSKSMAKASKSEVKEDEHSCTEDSSSEGDQESNSVSVDEEEEVAAVDSDNLDSMSDDAAPSKGGRKRKLVGGGVKGDSAKKKNGKTSLRKDSGDEEEEGKYDDGGKNRRIVNLESPVKAPKTDPGTHILLPTTLGFLRALGDNNDREWFSVHDAEYRHALDNWTAFVTKLVPVVSKVDWTVPELPARDLLHRIYRDMRFSKTPLPYKLNFSATFSRTGRKSLFAGYHINVSPQHGHFFGAGKWAPSASELASIRAGFLRDPQPFRKIINGKRFQKWFGSAKDRGTKGKGNVYGHEDELKSAPKLPYVTKDHPDIDLLKLRSVAVRAYFTDEQVLASNFIEVLTEVLEVVRPFVLCLNDMISPTSDSDVDGTGNEGGGDDDDSN